MILIALGANLSSQAGSPEQTLRASLAFLCAPAAPAVSVSKFYASPAWPDPSDPPFVNAVARIETSRDPASLMKLLAEIETHFGRVRAARNAPRTLDLDLLDYDGRIETGPPILPHPRIEARDFVLMPLRDVAPHWRHPISGKSVEELIAALPQVTVDRLPG